CLAIRDVSTIPTARGVEHIWLRSVGRSPLPPLFFFFMLPRPPKSTLFPYTTLFRSLGGRRRQRWRRFDSRTRTFLRNLWIKAHRSEEHTSELQSRFDLVCRLLLEKKNVSNRALAMTGRSHDAQSGSRSPAGVDGALA